MKVLIGNGLLRITGYSPGDDVSSSFISVLVVSGLSGEVGCKWGGSATVPSTGAGYGLHINSGLASGGIVPLLAQTGYIR